MNQQTVSTQQIRTAILQALTDAGLSIMYTDEGVVMSTDDKVFDKGVVAAAYRAAFVTPAMIEAGREVISGRWSEFIGPDGAQLWDEVLRDVFLAMAEAS